MTTTPVHVFYFRGLSTYGLDDAKWSIFNFGPMYRHVADAFGARGVNIHPVQGMGAGTLEEMAARARAWITAHPVWREGVHPIHLCAHSAGGLVARLVMDSLPGAESRVLSLLTFGAPNAGSKIARICVDMPVKHRGSTRLLRGFGYDVVGNRMFFEELLRERVSSMSGLSTRGARMASVVCYAPRSEYCVPLKLFYQIPAFKGVALESDGLVERDSQPLGEVIAELKIDHFRQIGLFGERARFDQLCDVITKFFKKSQ